MSVAPVPTTLLDAAGASRQPSAWSDAVLVLVDHQREYVDGKLPLTGMPEAVASCAELLALARRHGSPVIHVVHHGKAGGAFDPTGPHAAIIEGLTPSMASSPWSSTCRTALPAPTWPISWQPRAGRN
jgi:nicotinamidase-related amidase